MPVLSILTLLLLLSSPAAFAQPDDRSDGRLGSGNSPATNRLLELCKQPNSASDAVEAEIRNGANINATSRIRVVRQGEAIGWSAKQPLELAAMNTRDPEIIQLLVNAGAVPNRREVKAAVSHNSDPKVIAKIIELNALLPGPHVKYEDLLIIAVQFNQRLEVIKWLHAQAHANLDQSDDKNIGMSLFDVACGNNPNPEIIQLLLDKGASLSPTNPGGITPLMFATISNTPEIADLLIKSGSNVNATTRKGMTALLYAAMHTRYPGMFEVLVVAGANVNATDSENMTAVEFAAATNEHPGIMKALISSGVPVITQGSEGAPMLISAVSNTNPGVIDALIAAGLNPNDDQNGDSPLVLFSYLNKNPAMINALLEGGAEPDTPLVNPDLTHVNPLLIPGTTPLMSGCLNTSLQTPETLALLLDAGADVNEVNPAGNTALMYAASINFKPDNLNMAKRTHDMIHILLEAGASPDSTNKNGLTALDIARKNPSLTAMNLEKAFQVKVSNEDGQSK
ncbi:MAG: ankyrin repeat domain-containing protein [Phycisphaerales bacterium]|nr:ankyrin repeat domain-containing protein [Phycisphaerales bacterium]